MTTGNQLNYMLKQVNTVHMQCLRELELYIYYIIRCLGNNFDYDKLVNVLIDTDHNNGIAQCVVYPKECVVAGEGIINPPFFYGYTFGIMEDGIHLAFTENVNEFEKMRKKL